MLMSLDVLAKTPGLYLVSELRYSCHRCRPWCCRHACRCPPPLCPPPCCPPPRSSPPFHHHHHHEVDVLRCPRENPRSLSSPWAKILLSSVSSLMLWLYLLFSSTLLFSSFSSSSSWGWCPWMSSRKPQLYLVLELRYSYHWCPPCCCHCACGCRPPRCRPPCRSPPCYSPPCCHHHHEGDAPDMRNFGPNILTKMSESWQIWFC